MKYLFLLFIGISSLVGCAAEPPRTTVTVITKVQFSAQTVSGRTFGSGFTLRVETIPAEEFSFRYQNDQAFKDSIQSYQFSQ